MFDPLPRDLDRFCRRLAIGAAIAVVLVLACCALALRARAAPPDAADPQYDLLAPYSGQIRHWLSPQADENGWHIGCCSTADCRAVDARSDGDQVEVYLSDRVFQNGTNRWVVVPRAVILTDRDPTGPPFPVACWSAGRQVDGGFYCFRSGTQY